MDLKSRRGVQLSIALSKVMYRSLDPKKAGLLHFMTMFLIQSISHISFFAFRFPFLIPSILSVKLNYEQFQLLYLNCATTTHFMYKLKKLNWRYPYQNIFVWLSKCIFNIRYIDAKMLVKNNYTNTILYPWTRFPHKINVESSIPPWMYVVLMEKLRVRWCWWHRIRAIFLHKADTVSSVIKSM